MRFSHCLNLIVIIIIHWLFHSGDWSKCSFLNVKSIWRFIISLGLHHSLVLRTFLSIFNRLLYIKTGISIHVAHLGVHCLSWTSWRELWLILGTRIHIVLIRYNIFYLTFNFFDNSQRSHLLSSGIWYVATGVIEKILLRSFCNVFRILHRSHW